MMPIQDIKEGFIKAAFRRGNVVFLSLKFIGDSRLLTANMNWGKIPCLNLLHFLLNFDIALFAGAFVVFSVT